MFEVTGEMKQREILPPQIIIALETPAHGWISLSAMLCQVFMEECAPNVCQDLACEGACAADAPTTLQACRQFSLGLCLAL